MALRIIAVFLGAFSTVLLFLLSQEPYTFNFKVSDNKIAYIQMNIVQDYEITTDGVNSIVHAKEVLRFNDRDEFVNIDGILKKEPFINSLRAKKAILKDEKLNLFGDVFYARSDEITLECEQASYDFSTKVLSSNTFFTATFADHLGEGKGFVYKTTEGLLDAWDVKARIKTEKWWEK